MHPGKPNLPLLVPDRAARGCLLGGRPPFLLCCASADFVIVPEVSAALLYI